MRRHEWAKHIEDWKRSGLRAGEYGRRHGIAAKKLYWWSWFLRLRTSKTTLSAAQKRSAMVPASRTALLPVKLRASVGTRSAPAEVSVATGTVEVVLPSGAVIRASSAVDPVWLGRLVAIGTTAC